MIEYIDPQLFTWSRWRARSVIDLGITRCRLPVLIANKDKLLKHAVGYCRGENLVCRPKIDHMAVMYFTDCHFWFHLRNEEFHVIFES
jgi:hypothetical protein